MKTKININTIKNVFTAASTFTHISTHVAKSFTTVFFSVPSGEFII
jgi:hypothetical protein